ncbi:hypothetical protein O181_014592 [Austropuccinia psidii MF-1]|uniref:Uncharacterized protein n=1 Tax=Austropuccinia psidii MF-1 TaxID=1389203 RepID=A0A9Q3C0H5_9BASI|nr:hypothetical protein [Austropuccinia psidii MF-1]
MLENDQGKDKNESDQMALLFLKAFQPSPHNLFQSNSLAETAQLTCVSLSPEEKRMLVITLGAPNINLWRERKLNLKLLVRLQDNLQISNTDKKVGLKEMSEELHKELGHFFQQNREFFHSLISDFLKSKKPSGGIPCSIKRHEANRRIWTISQQILQRTIMMLWQNKRQRLTTNAQLTEAEAKQFEDYFQLSTTFPDLSLPLPLGGKAFFKPDTLGQTGETVKSILVGIMGVEEDNLRLATKYYIARRKERRRWWDIECFPEAIQGNGLNPLLFILAGDILSIGLKDERQTALGSKMSWFTTLYTDMRSGLLDWKKSPEYTRLVRFVGAQEHIETSNLSPLSLLISETNTLTQNPSSKTKATKKTREIKNNFPKLELLEKISKWLKV